MNFQHITRMHQADDIKHFQMEQMDSIPFYLKSKTSQKLHLEQPRLVCISLKPRYIRT